MNIKKIIKSREDRNALMIMLKPIPDKSFLKLMFWLRMGKQLDLDNPKTFNEKLQWLKINDRNPVYIKMVDKYEAKSYFASVIGSEHIIPNYGVWESFEDIDFNMLPQSFVLKCTHDSGSVIICRDKNAFDYEEARKKITRSLKQNYFWVGREWPYRYIKPRIIAEELLSDSTGIIDYKFYCFNGNPQFLYISRGLDNHETAEIDYLKLDWTRESFSRNDYRRFSILPDKPQNLDEMIEISKKIAKGKRFVRVDLYNITGKIYFSEITFFPGSGFTRFDPEKSDLLLGEAMHL
ncbi:ATP-grasp fold amidoligase family protein [Butyrivibrio sp. FCS006]|uniref:ATP-grasp fold amidoligase family protein n=1 Tax=Butyrivibrio sp. FCS006 TaxID=1280684 RepID=UPI0004207D48|nr:ATP-grasp fold amidoligase family protein [Butyrivibrio sp. FCS006]